MDFYLMCGNAWTILELLLLIVEGKRILIDRSTVRPLCDLSQHHHGLPEVTFLLQRMIFFHSNMD
jgi:hypothetical protein